MAIFGKKRQQNNEQTTGGDVESGVTGSLQAARGKFTAEDVIKQPRVTEKSTAMAERNVYVFDVDPRANKSTIKAAVQELFNVTPRKVNTVPVRSERVFIRGIRGKTTRGKKAYVYLREGDRIDT